MQQSDQHTPAYDFDTCYPRHGIGASKWQMMQAGGPREFAPDVFPFSVADMDFKVAPEIQAALHREADFAIYGYMHPTPRYYAAVCSWLQRRHQFTCQPEWIVQVQGIVFALFQLIRAFSEPGDGVIIQTPVYHPFFTAIEKQGRRVVGNPLVIVDGRYQMDLADLAAKAADPKTTLMILCSPHNPVGRVWTAAELAAVARICLENKVFLIADEIHFDLVFAPHRHTVLAGLDAEIARNSITCTAPSKTFNLAGLSTANLIIPDETRRKTFQHMLDLNGIDATNHFGTVACQAAYVSGEAWHLALMEYLTGNLRLYQQFMQENLPQLVTYPTEGTYLAWFDARPLGLEPAELTRFLQEKAQLYLSVGSWFGEAGAGFQRLNLALPRSALLAGLQRLAHALHG